MSVSRQNEVINTQPTFDSFSIRAVKRVARAPLQFAANSEAGFGIIVGAGSRRVDGW